MEKEDVTQEFVEFFKALADKNRLKIIGLLAVQPYNVEQMASLLNLTPSTVSHHLSYLAHIGLVSARAEGYYSIYQLETKALEDMAKRMLSRETLPSLVADLEPAADPEVLYERKVLKEFIRESGEIKAFPAQEKKFKVILRYVLQAFEPGVRYPEKQVNEIILRYNKDTASLRRGLIEYKYMARENGVYWRTDAGPKES